MVDLDHLYFEWLLTNLDPDGVTEEVAQLCGLLHRHEFRRRVGRDVNRASDGVALRKVFLANLEEADISPHVTNAFMMDECSWFEMLVALATHLDYLYEGGVEGRFLELIRNLELDYITRFGHEITEEDERLVEEATVRVDEDLFDRHGHGGLFPLYDLDHPDQREVEIWGQQAAYFRERLEGVLWTSTR